jgi:hypothetical protein
MSGLVSGNTRTVRCFRPLRCCRKNWLDYIYNTRWYMVHKISSLHFISLHLTSLHFTALHVTIISLHCTSLHLNALHFTTRHIFHFLPLLDLLDPLAVLYLQFVLHVMLLLSYSFVIHTDAPRHVYINSKDDTQMCFGRNIPFSGNTIQWTNSKTGCEWWNMSRKLYNPQYDLLLVSVVYGRKAYVR